MTAVPANDALTGPDTFDYEEERLAPRRTNQEALVIIKTREILINKETPGYKLYSRIAKGLFLASFLCLLVVIFGTIWFAYELVNSAHVLHSIQQGTANGVTR